MLLFFAPPARQAPMRVMRTRTEMHADAHGNAFAQLAPLEPLYSGGLG